jgi:hypothetical protein
VKEMSVGLAGHARPDVGKVCVGVLAESVDTTGIVVLEIIGEARMSNGRAR